MCSEFYPNKKEKIKDYFDKCYAHYEMQGTKAPLLFALSSFHNK